MNNISYPDTPGYQNTETSKAAARSMVSIAETRREEVFSKISASSFKGITAEQIRKSLELSCNCKVYPRISELRKKGRILDSGRKRRNENGRLATIWTIEGLAG